MSPDGAPGQPAPGAPAGQYGGPGQPQQGQYAQSPYGPGQPQPTPGRWEPSAFAVTSPEEPDRAQGGPAAPPEPARQSVPPFGGAPAETRLSAPLDPEHVPENAPRVLAGFIVSYEGDELGVFWPIRQGRNLVGRRDAAEGLDIEIDHPTTSSRHAVLFASARPTRLKVEDLGSTNGTFLNDEKLATGVRHELTDGQKLRFGGYTAIIKLV